MNTIVDRFEKIKLKISSSKPNKPVNIIAVSKTFTYSYIKPLIDYGHAHFGENKVQEALTKWSEEKKTNQNLKLHMIGKLQSNKAKDAVQLFDYIHSLDNQKLADILSKCEMNNGRKIKYFIQVNIGNELQKSGIPIKEIDDFYNYCTIEKKLNILGLMAIPPNDQNTKKYFKELSDINLTLGLKNLSMGMSSDYEDAVVNNSNYVRIGSLIFGKRS